MQYLRYVSQIISAICTFSLYNVHPLPRHSAHEVCTFDHHTSTKVSPFPFLINWLIRKVIALPACDQVIRQPIPGYQDCSHHSHTTIFTLLSDASILLVCSLVQTFLKASKLILFRLHLPSPQRSLSTEILITIMCQYEIKTYGGCRHKELLYVHGCASSYHQLMRIYRAPDTVIPFDWSENCRPQRGRNIGGRWSQGMCSTCKNGWRLRCVTGNWT